MSRENREDPPVPINSLLQLRMPEHIRAAVPDDPAELERRREEREERKRRVWLDAALDVARLRCVRFICENPDAKSLALDVTKDWYESKDHPHLLLRGTTGTGKSVAAAWLVRERVNPDRKGSKAIAWLYPDDVCSAVMHAWSDTAPKLAPFVVVDELGTETRPEFTTALSRLLDRDGTRVLFTTNLSAADFLARYGKDERFTSRAGGAVRVEDIAGRDRRKR